MTQVHRNSEFICLLKQLFLLILCSTSFITGDACFFSYFVVIVYLYQIFKIILFSDIVFLIHLLCIYVNLYVLSVFLLSVYNWSFFLSTLMFVFLSDEFISFLFIVMADTFIVIASIFAYIFILFCADATLFLFFSFSTFHCINFLYSPFPPTAYLKGVKLNILKHC